MHIYFFLLLLIYNNKSLSNAPIPSMTIWRLCVRLEALCMKYYNNTQPNLKRRYTDVLLYLHKCRSIRRIRDTLRFWRRLLFLNRDLFAVHFWEVEISRPMTPKMQNSCIVGWYDCAVVQGVLTGTEQVPSALFCVEFVYSDLSAMLLLETTIAQM